MSLSAFSYKDLKYLFAYIIPALAVFSIWMGGWWSLSLTIFIFGVIPILGSFLPADKTNILSEIESSRLRIRFFDYVLYLNAPIIYAVLIWSGFHLSNNIPYGIEWFGYTTALGILFGGVGINVAHELGHRSLRFERLLAKMLLLPSHFTHFIIEHNLGHHKYVATPDDPATARKGENVYSFWIRSTIHSYLNAWKIESNTLKRNNRPFWSFHNQMLIFLALHMLYNLLLLIFFGWIAWIVLFTAGIVGHLLLASTNYIEHYGLLRKRLPSGKYEPVLPQHSWNADYSFDRVLLYELSRHSDHHYKANRKYQILRSLPEAPYLPWGYSTALIVSLIPPIWFSIMDPKVEEQVLSHSS